VAQALAEHIRQRVPLPPPSRPFAVRTVEMKASRLGDIVGMLKLPDAQTIFRPQEVTIRQVRDGATAEPWRADPAADVLLLGDSFTNVYSDGEGQDGLGWGLSAGFGPHLSRFLGRPLDVIARNGSGATVTRVALARRADPLGGKRVVVWEFAIRDLACESWKVIPLEAKPAPVSPPPPAGDLIVEAKLITPVPEGAGKTELYVDALVVLKFTVRKVVSGTYDKPEILIKTPSILKRQAQPAAQLQAGQAVRMVVKPAEPSRVKNWRTFEVEGSLELDLPLWAEEIKPAP